MHDIIHTHSTTIFLDIKSSRFCVASPSLSFSHNFRIFRKSNKIELLLIWTGCEMGNKTIINSQVFFLLLRRCFDYCRHFFWMFSVFGFLWENPCKMIGRWITIHSHMRTLFLWTKQINLLISCLSSQSKIVCYSDIFALESAKWLQKCLSVDISNLTSPKKWYSCRHNTKLWTKKRGFVNDKWKQDVFDWNHTFALLIAIWVCEEVKLKYIWTMPFVCE